LVSLQIGELQDCHNEDELEDQLQCLPHDLDGVYDRIISGLKKHREDALTILQWLSFSVRPLELAEVAQVTGVVPDSNQGLRFKRSRALADPRSVLTICSSLVTETDGLCLKSNRNISLTHHAGIVKLSHMSVKDYLLSRHRVAATGFGIDEKLSHSHIAQTCLAYLLQLDNPDMLNCDTINNYPLAQYAAEYWVMHVQSGVEEWTEPQQKLVMTLLQPQHTALFISWVKIHNIDEPGSNIRSISFSIPSTLYYASLAILLPAVQALVKKGVDMNAQGGRYGNALQAASNRGHKAIVGLLVEKGADVNAHGGLYGNALQAGLPAQILRKLRVAHLQISRKLRRGLLWAHGHM